MYHKQPTAEQQAKAKERRDKIRAICDEIAAMDDTQRAALAAKCLAVTTDGHVLSFHNQMMIAYQFESATIVGGFQQWRKQGRAVKKGEHCISIWIPKTPKEKTGSAPSMMTDATPTAESKDHPNFFLGAVFDVSQTEPSQKG